MLDATLRQKPFAAADSAEHLVLHRLFRNAELLGNFFLWDAFQFTQDYDLAAAGWQRMKGFSQKGRFFAGGDLVGDIGSTIYDAQIGQICHALHRRIFFPTEEIQGDVLCDLEKKCPGRLDRPAGFGLPDAQVGLLNNIVDVADGGKRTAQVALEVRVVRVDFLLEPTRSLRRRRHARRFTGKGH